jgi:hypothetical protein
MDLNAFVIGIREQGIKTTSCHTYLRGVNSFLSWLHKNGHLGEHLKAKQLKVNWKVMSYLSDAEVKRLVGSKPQGGTGQGVDNRHALHRYESSDDTSTKTGSSLINRRGCSEPLDQGDNIAHRIVYSTLLG